MNDQPRIYFPLVHEKRFGMDVQATLSQHYELNIQYFKSKLT